MDISFFGIDELLSLRNEIDEELRRRKESNEIRLPIDSFAQHARRDVHCPECGSYRYTSNGLNRRRMRLICIDCGKTFGYLSGSMLDGSNLSLMRMRQLVLLIVLDLPAWVIGYLTGINQKTVQFWRYRLCDVAKTYFENTTLSDKVWIDETYWQITDKGMVYVKDDGTFLRGLSRNLICFIVAYDKYGHYYCSKAEKTGKIDSNAILAALKDRICAGSEIIHDGEHAHHALIEKLKLRETIVKTSDTDKTKRMEIETIDNVCALLKFEAYKHKGMRTGHMQELLPWFLFKSEYVTRHGIDDAVEFILTKLFDADKTQTYEERFKIHRKKVKA